MDYTRKGNIMKRKQQTKETASWPYVTSEIENGNCAIVVHAEAKEEICRCRNTWRAYQIAKLLNETAAKEKGATP